jgi:hypothetical protein
MGSTILIAFGWAFYLPHGLHPFIALLFVLRPRIWVRLRQTSVRTSMT